MALPEQKKKLLKAKIAVAFHDELGRVPKKEEIDNVFTGTSSLQSSPGAPLQTTGAKDKWTAGDLLISIGYARVSTADQTLALHKDALEKLGCDTRNKLHKLETDNFLLLSSVMVSMRCFSEIAAVTTLMQRLPPRSFLEGNRRVRDPTIKLEICFYKR